MRNGTVAGLTWVLVLGVTATLRGQVVQLPTFSVFSVQTTVVVPDGGGALLGGTAQARSMQSVQGVPGLAHLPWVGRLATSGGRASELRTSGVAVGATIHDREAMERELMAARPAGAAAPSRLAAEGAAAPAQGAPLLSVRAIHERHRLEQQRHEERLRGYLARGRAAEAAGRWGAARASYSLVARGSSGPLQREAQSRLDTLPNQ